MQINIDNKGVVIFGLPDAGKSTLANFIMRPYGAQAFIYDTLNEYPDSPLDRYVPKVRDGTKDGLEEYERIIRKAMIGCKYKLIAIDESNRYNPSKPTPLPQATADLNDWHAHYDEATMHIARLPVQLNQDITELSAYAFIFNLPGGLATDYLNTRIHGLGDFVKTIPRYHFVMVDHWQTYKLMKPVPREFATDKKIKVPQN